MYGGFSDCTAFNNEGSKAALYGRLLPEVGFHSSGHDILYNGMTGEQIETEIFIGPNYYMRLKHMVKDKINYRALGPRTALTKQPVSGRANDGGLRIGEMERDGVLGHGACEFLRESMMERGDEYQMVVCNTTGAIAIYNRARDLFMSPMADGPLRFFRSETGKGYALDTMTKYGRRFSVISIPYSLKLLIQELAAINVQLRIVTEDNLHQIDSMAFSDNLNRLTLDPNMTPENLVKEMERALRTGEALVRTPKPLNSKEELEYDREQMEIEAMNNAKKAFQERERQRREEELRERENNIPKSPEYAETSPAYEPPEDAESEYQATSPVYFPESPVSGGAVNSVSDFELGEQVYFTRSVDLGLAQNHIWKVAKKGGTLLTLTSDRGSIMGGGSSTNLTNSDFVQIAKADEVVKHDVFANWESQKAGALMAQQQHLSAQQQQPQYDMMRGGMLPQVPQIPQINIKMVGGNDFSKGEDDRGSGNSGENGVTITGGGQDTSAFNSLVIPSMKGGSGFESTKFEESTKKTDKTILGGLADFGNLVINKIM
jgi:hypothetical protein